jgi:hypothetical protein
MITSRTSMRVHLSLALAFASLALAGRFVLACATNDEDVVDATPTGTDGGSANAGKDAGDGEVDAGDAGPVTRDAASPPKDAGPYAKDCPGTKPQTQGGETCVGFGSTGSTCAKACGRPYGFVCVDGGPPGFTDCVRVSTSFLGDTYCCTENACVAMPDRNADCNGVAGKPKRYQCPVGDDGGAQAAPAGCTEKGSGASSAEKFYCCP